MSKTSEQARLDANGSRETLFLRVLDGPITVAHKKVGSVWHSTALEFDLVGIGKNRSESLRQLKGVVNTYLADMIQAKGKVRFFNPSEAKEWECEDKVYFSVTVAIAAQKEILPARLSFSGARRYRKSIRSMDMLLMACLA